MIDDSRWRYFSNPAFVWGLLGAAACASVAPLEPNMLEEGFIVEIAQRLARGDHLYRDAVAFTGPLPYELLGSLFRLFGESLATGRVVIALLHGLATASVFSIARAAEAKERAHIAAAALAASPILLFPLLSLYFYTTLSFSLAIIATDASLRGLRSLRWAVVSGVLVACVALCKQTVGALLAITLLVSLVSCSAPQMRLRALLGYAAGGVGAAILTLGYYAILGDLGALYHSLVTLPMTFEASFDSPYMNFWPPGEFSPAIDASRMFYVPYFYELMYGFWQVPGPRIILATQIIYAIPIIAVLATLARRIIGPLTSAVWFHFAVLIALISNVFPRADWGHVVFVLPSACVQLSLLAKPGRQPARVGRGAFALLVTAVFVVASLWTAVTLYDRSVPPNLGPRVPFRSLSTAMKGWMISHTVSYLRERVTPDEEIFVARAEPLIYFATGTRNATPYGGVIPGMREEQQSVIVEALGRIRFVVMNEIDDPLFLYYSEELPSVQAYLERFYEIPSDYMPRWVPPRLMVLEKVRDRGATAIDFIVSRESAKAWTREYGGEPVAAELNLKRRAARLNRRFLVHSIASGGGGIDFQFRVPEGAVFQTDVGYPHMFDSSRIFELPRLRNLRFLVSIARVDSGEFVELYRMPDQKVFKKPLQRWIPVEIDLAAYRGEVVTLRLELQARERLAQDETFAWWGSPRVALRASE